MQQMKPLIQRAAMEMLAKEKPEIQKQIVQSVMAATLIILHDKYDWNAGQLKQIMNEIFKQFELVNEKYVKVEDFYKLLGEMGIKVM